MLKEDLSVDKNTIFSIVKDTVECSGEVAHASQIVEKISDNIIEILSMPEKSIKLEMISRYFDEVFHSQMKSLSQGRMINLY